jgi:hypothetical protein
MCQRRTAETGMDSSVMAAPPVGRGAQAPAVCTRLRQVLKAVTSPLPPTNDDDVAVRARGRFSARLKPLP